MFFVERYTSVTGQYHEKFTPGGKFFMLLAGKKKRKKKKRKRKRGKRRRGKKGKKEAREFNLLF